MNLKLLGGGAALLVLVAFGAGYYGGTPRTAALPTAPATILMQKSAASANSANSSTSTTATPATTTAPPPWAASAALTMPVIAPPTAATPLPANLDPATRKKIEQIQADLLQSMRDGKPADPRRVDAALLAIKQAAGTPIVGGINLDAVRSNLAVAEQIQTVAQEIQRETQKSGPVDTQRMNAHAARLQKLQAQLQTDVSAAGARSK